MLVIATRRADDYMQVLQLFEELRFSNYDFYLFERFFLAGS